MKNFFSKIINFIKALPKKAVAFFKSIPRYMYIPIIFSALVCVQIFVLNFGPDHRTSPPLYTVTYGGSNGGYIAGAHTQIVEESKQTGKIRAVPFTGYEFVKWSDGLTEDVRQEFNVRQDIYVYPIFKEIEYTVTYKGVCEDTVLYEHQYPQEYNDNITFEAFDLDRYTFLGWSDGKTEKSRTDTHDVAGQVFTANYELLPEYVQPEYTLFYEGVVGDYVFYSESYVNDVTEKMIYAAKDIPGYRFVGWSDGVKTFTRTDTNAVAGKKFIATYEIEPLDAPIFEIFTQDYAQILSKTQPVPCTLSISNARTEYCASNLVADIRGRGTSTWTMPKKSYRVSFETAQSLFGSEYTATDWTLINNYADKSLSRNALAQEMAARFEDISYASTYQFVEVFLNHEYMGVYLLCDQIEAGEGRVDVENTYAADGNNDYFIELNGHSSSGGTEGVDCFRLSDNYYYYSIVPPYAEHPSYNPDVHLNYIKNYMNSCLSAVKSGNWNNICSLIDVNSFADAYLIEELFANVDCGWTDFYFTKKKDGKLFAGPVWDFDISSGNDNYAMGNAETCPPDETLYVAKDNPWYKELCAIPQFKQLVADKLLHYQTTIEEVIALVDTQPNTSTTSRTGFYSLYRFAFNRNFERWDILNTQLGQEPNDLAAIHTVKGQLDYLRNWLTARYEYLCEQYGVTLS